MIFIDIISTFLIFLTIIEKYEYILLGRFLLGIFQGINIANIPVYINQMSPDVIKGISGSFF